MSDTGSWLKLVKLVRFYYTMSPYRWKNDVCLTGMISIFIRFCHQFIHSVPFKGLTTWAGLARIAGLVSVCRDLGTFVKRNKKSTPRLHDNRTSPVSRDPGIAVPGSWLTGLRFFYVIAFAGPARLINPMKVRNQARSGFPRFIASAINRSTGLARLM